MNVKEVVKNNIDDIMATIEDRVESALRGKLAYSLYIDKDGYIVCAEPGDERYYSQLSRSYTFDEDLVQIAFIDCRGFWFSQYTDDYVDHSDDEDYDPEEEGIQNVLADIDFADIRFDLLEFDDYYEDHYPVWIKY